MYIAYILIIDLFDVIPLLILCFEHKGGEEYVFIGLSLTPLLMIDKKGEKYFSIYACFGKRIYVHAYCFVLQIGEKVFDVFHACLCMFIFLYLHSCL